MDRLPISVIIPSALRAMPDSNKLWLERAIESVCAQAVLPQEIIAGLDPDACLPPLSSEWPICLRTAKGAVRGHQAATNAAVACAYWPTLALLEDDDVWTPDHLPLLWRVMGETQSHFVSTSQEEVDLAGQSLGHEAFDYPTASGWLVSRLLWMKIGGFDARYRIHHDNAFLGKINRKLKDSYFRVHIVEKGADFRRRPRLHLIARNASVYRGLDHLTVRRTIHPGSIMGGMGADPARQQRSAMEYAALEVLYGMADTW